MSKKKEMASLLDHIDNQAFNALLLGGIESGRLKSVENILQAEVDVIYLQLINHVEKKTNWKKVSTSLISDYKNRNFEAISKGTLGTVLKFNSVLDSDNVPKWIKLEKVSHSESIPVEQLEASGNVWRYLMNILPKFIDKLNAVILNREFADDQVLYILQPPKLYLTTEAAIVTPMIHSVFGYALNPKGKKNFDSTYEEQVELPLKYTAQIAFPTEIAPETTLAVIDGVPCEITDGTVNPINS